MKDQVIIEKNGKITAELRRLEQKVSELDNLLSSLPAVLAPILTPENPEKSDAPSSPDANSPLGRELSELASEVESLVKFVMGILDRIDI